MRTQHTPDESLTIIIHADHKSFKTINTHNAYLHQSSLQSLGPLHDFGTKRHGARQDVNVVQRKMKDDIRHTVKGRCAGYRPAITSARVPKWYQATASLSGQLTQP